MTISYRALITLLTPLIFIYLWLRGRRAPHYRQRWRERLALQSVPAQARDGIVIHCVSVGETVAARALIEAILQHYPQLPITLTAMTPTAAELARKLFGDRVHHCYLPIDTHAAMRRFIDKFAPRCLIILETELWPNLLAHAKNYGSKVIVVNARLSAKSLKTYQRFNWLLGPIWSALDLVICQNSDTERRFRELGVQQQRTLVRGNLKFDFGPHASGQRFHECVEIRPQGSIIVFPSYVYHQVTPVTSGTRYSLVLWSLGQPFK